MLDEILEGAAEVAAEAGGKLAEVAAEVGGEAAGKLAEGAVELAGEALDLISSAAEIVTDIPDFRTSEDEKKEQKS